MSMYEIISTVLWIVFGFVVAYVKQKQKLIETAQSAINTAEEHFTEAKSGALKHSWVVEQLFNITPGPMKLLFTKEVIGDLVQKVFDLMADYATQQLDKIVKD